MSNKKLFVAFLIPALLLFGGYGIWALSKSDGNTGESAPSSSDASTNTRQPANNDDTNDSTSSDQPISLTRDEVSQHNSEDDCWTIIDGNVYDLTSYIPRHPGGDDILEACGSDGSSLFNQRQTSDGESVGSGTPHSSNAQSQLQSLYVGKLAS